MSGVPVAVHGCKTKGGGGSDAIASETTPVPRIGIADVSLPAVPRNKTHSEFTFERHSLGPSPRALEDAYASALGNLPALGPPKTQPSPSPSPLLGQGQTSSSKMRSIKNNLPGRRVVSLDSRGGIGISAATLGYLGPDGVKHRSHSAESVIDHKDFVPPSVMVPLNFDKIQEDIMHPLSSLRSCSEFGMHGVGPAETPLSAPKKKSMWKRTVGWFKGKKKTEDTGELLSMAERSKLAQMGEDYHQQVYQQGQGQGQRQASTVVRQRQWSTQPTPRLSSDSAYSAYQPQSESGRRDSTTSGAHARRDSSSHTPTGKRKHEKKSPSLVKEFSSTFWGTLGVHHDHAGCSKDIEMKTFRIAGAWVLPIEGGFSPMSRTSSARSLSSRDSLTSRPGYLPAVGGGVTRGGVIRPVTAVVDMAVFDVVFSDLWYLLYVSEYFKTFAEYSLMGVDYLRDLSLRFGAEEFFDLMRIQPVTTGNYFRGMLTAGVVSTIFNGHALVSMHQVYEEEQRNEEYASICGCLVYTWLVIVTLLNLIQLPLRISIHLKLLLIPQATVHEAGDILRELSSCDPWVFNKLINWLIDIFSVIGLFLAEIYIYYYMLPACGDGETDLSSCSSSNSLGNLVVSTAATVVLTLIIRTTIAVLFCASAADPLTLSEARKRGLSRYDVDKLPAFLYTDREDVNNPTCSICLCSFDLGEMLICLPCDARHSFHASCIRDWLVRQNACPLCQKLV
jgi:hypothetical protein